MNKRELIGLLVFFLALGTAEGGLIVLVCSSLGTTDNTKLVLGTQGPVILQIFWIIILIWIERIGE